MHELDETIGDRELCAWRVAPAYVWIQTRLPAMAAIMERRVAFKRVAYAVTGGYLRIFESQMTLKQASELLASLTSTPKKQLENA